MSHLDRDCVAVRTSRPFDFDSHRGRFLTQLFGLTCCPECVSLCVCVCQGERDSQCVFNHSQALLAVSAVSVWLGSALCFTASNLYSVLLLLCSSVLHSLLVSLLYSSLFPFSLGFSSRSDHSFHCVLHLFFSLILSVLLNIVSFSVAHLSNSPPLPVPLLLPLLKSVWSPLIPSAPGVVVLGWMSALRIRALKREEQQPKPWNPLNLSFSLSCFNWHC